MEHDFHSLTGSQPGESEQGLARRDFVRLSLGAGFAAAVLPVMAQSVITTDSNGLDQASINLDVAGQSVPVYYAKPAGKMNLPIVLVVSEIFGVHQHIADVARRFAKQGYLALAPDLFVRQGDAQKYTVIAELIKEVISKVPDQQVMNDLDAVVAWAEKNGGDSKRLAVTGFCWGGRITWMYAAHNPKVKTGAAWYGRLAGAGNALTPTNPIDIAADLKAPILGLYGAKDTGIPVDTVKQMEQALAKGKSGSQFQVYADSGHAFHADYRPSYNATDAQDAWQRCLAWFKQHGVS